MKSDWDRLRLAFLRTKTNGTRTAKSYSLILARFFAANEGEGLITPEAVEAWCYGPLLDGRKPSDSTIGAKLACLASFFRFAVREGFITHNPCDGLSQPGNQVAPRAPALTVWECRRLLAVLPDTPVGLRTRSVILTLALTGRRRSEVLELRTGDLSGDGPVFYSYRGKGGKTGKRELPEPAFTAIVAALAAAGTPFATLGPDERLFGPVTQHSHYLAVRRAMKRAGLQPCGLEVLTYSPAFDAEKERVAAVTSWLGLSVPVRPCHDLVWRPRAGGWQLCGRAALYLLVVLQDGYVHAERQTAGGIYCQEHALRCVASKNESRRALLRFEHGELLHRTVVAGCVDCRPI